MDFVEWLEHELRARGWSQSDLARRGGIRPNNVSRVLNRERNPGPDFCRAIARALGYSQEMVFRKAGLIDDRPLKRDDPELAAFLARFEKLTPEQQENVLTYMRFLLEEQERERRRMERENARRNPRSAAALP